MSKRLESRSWGLPHLGQSLGVGRLCFRFFTTSRMFCSMSMECLAPAWVLLWFSGFRCFLLGSPFGLGGIRVFGLCGRLGVGFGRFWLFLRRRSRFSFFGLVGSCLCPCRLFRRLWLLLFRIFLFLSVL